MYKPEYVDINLSKLLPEMGKMVPGVNMEMAIIRYYKKVVTDKYNTLELVNNYVCNYLYMTKDVKYNYSDLIGMVKISNYDNKMFAFHNLLEHVIARNVNPYVKDVMYDKLVDKENFIVRFRLYYD